MEGFEKVSMRARAETRGAWHVGLAEPGQGSPVSARVGRGGETRRREAPISTPPTEARGAVLKWEASIMKYLVYVRKVNCTTSIVGSMHGSAVV